MLNNEICFDASSVLPCAGCVWVRTIPLVGNSRGIDVDACTDIDTLEALGSGSDDLGGGDQVGGGDTEGGSMFGLFALCAGEESRGHAGRGDDVVFVRAVRLGIAKNASDVGLDDAEGLDIGRVGVVETSIAMGLLLDDARKPLVVLVVCAALEELLEVVATTEGKLEERLALEVGPLVLVLEEFAEGGAHRPETNKVLLELGFRHRVQVGDSAALLRRPFYLFLLRQLDTLLLLSFGQVRLCLRRRKCRLLHEHELGVRREVHLRIHRTQLLVPEALLQLRPHADLVPHPNPSALGLGGLPDRLLLARVDSSDGDERVPPLEREGPLQPEVATRSMAVEGGVDLANLWVE
ncbi:hypothetical protein GSI_14098 [Ganoderma sinense ZZ0214-1]|uniref:Uncharacterized protein n=1 Tax=Ganoderma sinense ZZ0214-1 TaxID=1077348 RepID=A0A2G8RS52_9APHY|nr:hypothetical protein GSI_14098 [Ganoderma sinense ZZ0214-1]